MVTRSEEKYSVFVSQRVVPFMEQIHSEIDAFLKPEVRQRINPIMIAMVQKAFAMGMEADSFLRKGGG